MPRSDREEGRFREIFRALHAGHLRCEDDEWLAVPCRRPDGRLADRPVVWSRRNGPWRRSEILWVGAAPGNAGGKGAGTLGAHGTRIPFGGDVAGGNLDTLMAAIGVDRNGTFITAALNQLPARGGGEPAAAELAAPAGRFPSSVHALRATLVAVGPRLVVALGNVALRCSLAAPAVSDGPGPRLPSLDRIRRGGLERGRVAPWPADPQPGAGFRDEWRAAWGADTPLPRVLWLTHPSAQNMSPYAGRGTGFHTRMLEARAALHDAVRSALGREPPARPAPAPESGIYALPEWVQLVGPRHAELRRLWRGKGV